MASNHLFTVLITSACSYLPGTRVAKAVAAEFEKERVANHPQQKELQQFEQCRPVAPQLRLAEDEKFNASDITLPSP
ncbi:hypothetical protein FJT64_015012 [Amphibalanus amphitrite]|uniref:Uncharacterized protein n=1 Tax=Amphibalanus amphitrite TaxID=1232801 RepID=A0A6A4XHL6_AMPAM|nr:hypothetical protein FJT64_015012 [Amphibalanus amphitrite]